MFVENLSEVMVMSPEEILDLMKSGEKHRHFGATNMNERSSRYANKYVILLLNWGSPMYDIVALVGRAQWFCDDNTKALVLKSVMRGVKIVKNCVRDVICRQYPRKDLNVNKIKESLGFVNLFSDPTRFSE